MKNKIRQKLFIGILSLSMIIIGSMFNVGITAFATEEYPTLNSSSVSSYNLKSYTRKYIVLPEVLHAFGLKDCTKRDYVMCEDFVLAKINEITNYEINLSKSKYN